MPFIMILNFSLILIVSIHKDSFHLTKKTSNLTLSCHLDMVQGSNSFVFDSVTSFDYLFIYFACRNCVGMRFALIEAKLVLCKILLKYRFVVAPNTDIPLEFACTRPGFLQVKRIILNVEKRK